MNGQDLKKWRERHGKSQAWLAEKLGYKVLQITRWEADNPAPRPIVGLAIAEIDRQLKAGEIE